MGLLKSLFKPSLERQEQRGDDCVRASDWGMAKVAYEAALDALEKRSPDDAESRARILEKRDGSMEALSRQHVRTARELIESGYADDARELLELAMDLTRDETRRSDIEERLKGLDRSTSLIDQDIPAESELLWRGDGAGGVDSGEEETFAALCGALPEEIRGQYVSYGPLFRAGYLALNRGDFQSAADALSRAMEEDPSPESLIPLELGTAFLNLRRLDEARGLLEPFLERHPDVLPGYQVLCEVFWEMRAFDRAETLLESCPGELKDSDAYILLRGESLSQAGRHSEAVSHYESFIKEYGRHDAVLKALAGSYESLGDLVKASDLYMDIMNQCQSCRATVDPLVQRKLADIRFRLGEHDTAVLESYLSLAQEDPANRAFYFDRISRIYASMGNEGEARRFSQFARQSGEGDA